MTLRTRVLAGGMMLVGILMAVACGGTAKTGHVPSIPGAGSIPSTILADGQIAGLKLGDSLDTCLVLWGEPEEQEGGGATELFVYRYFKNGLQVTFSNSTRSVVSVALLLTIDPALPDATRFIARPLDLSLEPFKNYRREQRDRLAHYDFPSWDIWVLQSPDGRKVHFLELTTKEFGVPGAFGALAQPLDASPIPAEIPITVDEIRSPALTYTTVLAGNADDWEQGMVYTPAIWQQGSLLRMAYVGGRTVNTIGFATSADGKTWVREAMGPMSVPTGGLHLNGPTWIPGRNKLFSNVVVPGSNLGIFAWDLRAGGMPIPRGYVSKPSDIRPGVNGNDPRSVVAIGNKLYLYSHSLSEKNQSAIYRSESTDGTHWSRPHIVLEPALVGVDIGGVSSPYVVHDSATGDWMMWYIANSQGNSVDENLLARARSRDGVTWTNRELFLRPEWLSPNIRHLSTPCQMHTPTGDYLYLSAYDPAHKTTIIRLDIANPHRVSAPRPVR